MSGYNLLKEAVTGHLLRHEGEKCVLRRIVLPVSGQKKCWMKKKKERKRIGHGMSEMTDAQMVLDG